MFLSLLSFGNALRPFILSPPMFGSVLYGNVKDLKTHWYCKSNLKNEWFWLTDKFVIPPIINCLANYLKITTDASGEPVTRPEGEFWTIDFGGDKALRYLDPGIFGHHFIPLLYKVLDRFATGGFKIRENMFGAPYDWRFNPVPTKVMTQYFADLKGLVEQAYTKNANTKVALYGFSAGTAALLKFLTEYVDQTWKDKYVDRVLWMGPSFAGSTEAIEVIWKQNIYFLPSIVQTADVGDLALSIPTLYGHLPNFYIWGQKPIITGPNGLSVKAEGVRDFLIQHNKVKPENQKIYDRALPLLKSDVVDCGVDSYFLFNSFISTPVSFEFDDKFSSYSTKNGQGDGTINDFGLYYACNNWKSTHARVCHDIQINDDKYNHSGMVVREEVAEILFWAVNNDSWKVAGSHNKTGLAPNAWKDGWVNEKPTL